MWKAYCGWANGNVHFGAFGGSAAGLVLEFASSDLFHPVLTQEIAVMFKCFTPLKNNLRDRANQRPIGLGTKMWRKLGESVPHGNHEPNLR